VTNDHKKNSINNLRSKNQFNNLSWCLGALVVFILFGAGCKVGPNYQRPTVNAPSNFRGETDPSTNSFGDVPWPQIFPDPNLQALIRAALTNNYDVRVAVTRIIQAHETVVQTRAPLFPQLNYNGVAGTGKNFAPPTGAFPTGTSANIFEGYLSASWQVDLFGRIKRMTEAARAQYFVTQEARRDVTISLISQVAQNYFQLLALDRELEIAREATNSYGGSLKIFSERLRYGTASKLETSSAEALLESYAATIPDLERQIAQSENQLSYLLGQNPRAIVRENSKLDEQLPTEVPAGLPSRLLERRPDVREAEQQLRAANAQVGVAKADFFPQMSLTGLFGKVSPELSGLTGGASLAYGAAAGLTGPIFQAGRIRAEYRQALAAREQFVLQYQGTVLNALQEVSTALIARQKLAESRELHARSVMLYREAVKIVNQRYILGQSSYFEVLQEEELLYPEEDALVQTELNQLNANVQLYLFLGGGWETEGKNESSQKD
jgi:multidrug efflux system outer membrane protein